MGVIDKRPFYLMSSLKKVSSCIYWAARFLASLISCNILFLLEGHAFDGQILKITCWFKRIFHHYVLRVPLALSLSIFHQQWEFTLYPNIKSNSCVAKRCRIRKKTLEKHWFSGISDNSGRFTHGKKWLAQKQRNDQTTSIWRRRPGLGWGCFSLSNKHLGGRRCWSWCGSPHKGFILWWKI